MILLQILDEGTLTDSQGGYYPTVRSYQGLTFLGSFQVAKLISRFNQKLRRFSWNADLNFAEHHYLLDE